MTIPEAVRLVLLSTTLASLGEIFILKMGKPLKILDVAHKLLEINGKTLKDENNPNGDIEINYIGLRPGEKIDEKLIASYEYPESTIYSEIDLVKPPTPIDSNSKFVSSLLNYLESNNLVQLKSLIISLISH